MDILITPEMREGLGDLTTWGIDVERGRWGNCYVHLRSVSNENVKVLEARLKAHSKVKGVRAALHDIAVWIEAGTGLEKVKCRNTKQFSSLVYEFLKVQPGHWVYQKDEAREVWKALYVGAIKFFEREEARSGNYAIPAHTNLTFFSRELGQVKATTARFEDQDVRGKTPRQVLVEKGYLVQTADLRAAYDKDMALYDQWYDKVGLQFLAFGVGTDDLDDRERNRWSWGTRDTIELDKGGEPSHVVIDIIHEGQDKRSSDKERYDPDFWSRAPSLLDENERDDPEGEGTEEPVQVPVFPVLPTFDLRRHKRLGVHVGNLELYAYDERIGERLVLPSETRDLVSLLVSDNSEFRDIIKHKGGGAVILCAGPPGCGKTLTAEVYAEVMKRPLYSVQCSQLGTDETALENELMLVFSRSSRWNAILLLDEADVYVANRGSDLQQNAIVGVFLRVLEYYSGVLFMTTNRSDLVDDAITSRCLARIDYQLPNRDDQARIWSVLSEGAGIRLADGMINEVVHLYPRLSGRDVKQLLKLASKVTRVRGEEVVTLQTVEFVKRFKPTPGDGKEPIT